MKSFIKFLEEKIEGCKATEAPYRDKIIYQIVLDEYNEQLCNTEVIKIHNHGKGYGFEARKLIPMVDYVLIHMNEAIKESNMSPHLVDYLRLNCSINCYNYAKLLKTELNVSMFVPAVFEDGQWVVLEKPKVGVKAVQQYQAALDNVIFEGFKLIDISHGLRIIKNKELDCKVFSNRFQNHYYKCNEFDTIEDLTEYSPILTKKAYEKYFKN